MTVNVFCRGFLVINPEDAFGVVRVCSYSSNSDITPKISIMITFSKVNYEITISEIDILQ